MEIFGLSDPFIIAAYAGCFLTVALCISWTLLAGDGGESVAGRIRRRRGGR